MSTGEAVWVIVKLLLACIPLAISTTALLDAARRPAWAWALADRDRAVWVALTGFGILFCGPGMVTAALYWFRVRPRVAAAEAGRLP